MFPSVSTNFSILAISTEGRASGGDYFNWLVRWFWLALIVLF